MSMPLIVREFGVAAVAEPDSRAIAPAPNAPLFMIGMDIVMALPTLLVLSRDASFVEMLQARVAGKFAVHAVADHREAVARARALQPSGFLGDFREVTAGGHAEAGLLEDLRGLPHHPRLMVLLGEGCPEPLARHIACLGARLMREPAAVVDAVNRFDDESIRTGEEPDDDGQPWTRNGASRAEEDCMLLGLTRQFATNTPALRLMLADLEVAARHDVTVLLVGETGSGKTYLSRLIHEISPRRGVPFVPVACGALPADLIESELFGHVKGAFTSAHADKDGKFVAAGKGTILLDEIDSLGLEQQVKLLRVIESGEFEPVGSNRTLKSEARLIVASNVDLQPLVEQKRFRADLYYRLSMLKFEIPPLRLRRPDIVPLARKFISELAARHSVEIVHVDENVFTALLKYPWPGNVRELEHVIQRAVIYSRGGVLLARQLPAHVVLCQPGPGHDGGPARAVCGDASPGAGHAVGALGRQMAMSEREIIQQTLFQHNDSRTKAARALGISRVTLYNKMKKYGMMPH